MHIQTNSPLISSSRWRMITGIGILIAINMLIFSVVVIFSGSPQVASAQGGTGQPDNKVEAIDFYPEPFANGAMAYSLRDPWNKSDLTYYFHNCPTRLDCQEGRSAVRTGFETWATVSALTFEEVFNVSEADIEVTWTSSDPEGSLGEPGGVLAYNYFPRYGGDMFIDDTEPWTIGDGGEFDLVLTATHEIGHGIGLAHSEFTSAIMYAYAGYASELGTDDITAIQELYGPPEGTTPPATDEGNIDNPNGDLPTAVDVENVDEVSGSINNSNSYDIWTLDVEADITVTLTMRSTGGDLDPLVGILTEDQSDVLAENDNWFGNDARVVYTFDEAGTFSVVATRFGLQNGSSSGTYTLTAEFSQNGDGGTNDTQPPEPQTIVWRVTNYADTELCQIYYSESSNDTWGIDQTEGDPLENNFYYEWDVETGTYDLQVWDCFGNKLEEYSINANRNVDVQIYADRIIVVPLINVDSTSPPPSSSSFTWRVSNYADVELCAIYYNTSDQDSWGENHIADEDPLQANFYYEWDIEPGTLDLRVEDCDGGFLESYAIEFNKNLELAVFQDEIITRDLD